MSRFPEVFTGRVQAGAFGGAILLYFALAAASALVAFILGALLLTHDAFPTGVTVLFLVLAGAMVYSTQLCYRLARKYQHYERIAAQGEVPLLSVGPDGVGCFMGLLENNNMLTANRPDGQYLQTWPETASVRFAAPHRPMSGDGSHPSALILKRIDGQRDLFIPLNQLPDRAPIIAAVEAHWHGPVSIDDGFERSGAREFGFL